MADTKKVTKKKPKLEILTSKYLTPPKRTKPNHENLSSKFLPKNK